MIRVAASCGADIVKFQAWSAELLTSRHAEMATYQVANTGASTSQLELLKSLELPPQVYPDLVATCREHKVEFLCTPMDMPSIRMLAELKVSWLKLPSGELTNAPYLVAAGATKIPCIVSTGMGSLPEIKAALGAIAWGYFGKAGSPNFEKCSEFWEKVQKDKSMQRVITLLHCTTEYPAPIGDVNLLAMKTLGDAFELCVGYSDHTAGINVGIAAAALGATFVEKHFTLDRSLPGPDHLASVEPTELKALVEGIKQANACLGRTEKAPAASEIKNMPIARKSLVAARSIAAGEKFTVENLTTKRPGGGQSPWKYWDYLGKPASRDYEADDLILDEENEP
jgi:N-acetylneuraminate synthase